MCSSSCELYLAIGSLLSSVRLKAETEKPIPIVWRSALWEPEMQTHSFLNLPQNIVKALLTREVEASTCTPRIWFHFLPIPSPEPEFLSLLTVYNWAWGTVSWVREPNSCQRHRSRWKHIHQPEGRESYSWKASNCRTGFTWSLAAEVMKVKLKNLITFVIFVNEVEWSTMNPRNLLPHICPKNRSSKPKYRRRIPSFPAEKEAEHFPWLSSETPRCYILLTPQNNHYAGCSRLPAVHSRSRRYFHLTCPRSRVTFTSLYASPLERGGLCHHRSVPSMALVTGWALFGSTELQESQNWPWMVSN